MKRNPGNQNSLADRGPRTGNWPAAAGTASAAAKSPFDFPAKKTVISLILFALVAWTFFPSVHNGFVDFDDPLYVTENTHVQGGLTLENIGWAFRSAEASNWHPLTWLSHMADCQIHGMNPRGHHLTSLLIHAANAVLFFWVLQMMTGAAWRSLAVALLFGLHPLRVESVAWVAERKDVLSAFFGLLALIFHARYAHKKSSTHQPSPINYAVALLCFALGLMSKPMLVTWPFVLLLLDYWPLERWRRASARWLLLEKLPFFLLAAAASAITLVAQKGGGAVKLSITAGDKMENALVAYGRYLGKLFWPADLSFYYPHPGDWPGLAVFGSGLLFLGISALVILLRRRGPYLPVGWFWYAGTLVPVIGLVQVGGQSMADRYTYLPSMGLLVLLVWGLQDLTRRWRYQAVALAAVTAAVLVAGVAQTRRQIGYWQESEILYRHGIEVTGENALANYNLGSLLGKQGRVDEAIHHYQEAVRLKPGYSAAHINLGVLLEQKGLLDEAIHHYKLVLRNDPADFGAHYNLGIALDKKGLLDVAIDEFKETLRLKPDHPQAHSSLGFAHVRQGRLDEAIAQYRETLRLRPDDIDAHHNLGALLGHRGDLGEAAGHYRSVLQLRPDDADARNGLNALMNLQNNGHPAPSQKP